MHVAFATCFFIIVGLNETLRHGIFGMNPSETAGITFGAVAFCALIILRSDIVFTIRRPDHAIYDNARLNWTWPRTILGVFLGPLLWIIPLAYGFALIQINMHPMSAETLVELIVFQVVMISFAQVLFFQEAVIKAFRGHIVMIFVASTLAFFIFNLPGGAPAAMIAAGTAIYCLTLRMVGTNILVVGAIHGVTTVMLTQVFSLGLTQAEFWPYAIYFFAAAATLSLVVYGIFSQTRSELQYA